MTVRPWMPLYVADFVADTMHLGAAETGAYLLLLGHYWLNGGLPDDDRALARIARMSLKEWRGVRPTIKSFFSDDWKQKRLEEELAHTAKISSKRSASAKQRHNKSSANAEHLDTHLQLQLSSQERKNKKDADAGASHSDFASAPPATDEADLYRRGKIVLGANAGGLIKKLIAAKSGSIPLARSAIETASTKSDPREYLGAIIRNREGVDDLRARGEAW